MPPRKKRAASPALPRLQNFENGLLGTRMPTTEALLESLKSLAEQLANFEQDQVDLTSIDGVKNQLVERRILIHKDKGVKAYTCVCIAEILRLYAPTAPYTQDDLADIFDFFFRQLSTAQLTAGSGGYFEQFHHLLESLATVKSVVLVCDLERWEETLLNVVKSCFTIVGKGAFGLPPKLQLYIQEVLAALVDEASSVPSDVLDLFLAPFQNANTAVTETSETKGKLRDKADKNGPSAGQDPRLRLASAVLSATKEKMSRVIGIWFGENIVKTSTETAYPSDEESVDEEPAKVGLTARQVKEVEAVHLIIRSIHANAGPGVLASIVPQIEEELRVEDLAIRSIATTTLGAMYITANTPKALELIRSHPSCWATWMGRRNDKNPQIRALWAQHVHGLMLLPDAPNYNLEIRKPIQEAVTGKLLDPDEKVRLTLIQSFTQLSYEAALRHVDLATLKTLGGRGVDKRYAVRHAALTALGRLFDLAYSELETNDAHARLHFGWIPGEILLGLDGLGGVQEVRGLVEEVFATYIIPLPSLSEKGTKSSGNLTQAESSRKSATDAEEKAMSEQFTNRLLCVLKFVSMTHPGAEEKLMDKLLGMAGLRGARPSLYQHYIDLCSPASALTNGAGNNAAANMSKEEKEKKLGNVIRHLSVTLAGQGSTVPTSSGGSTSAAEPLTAARVSEDLHAFAKLGDARLSGTLRKAIDVNVGVASLGKAVNDLTRRLTSVSSGLVPTMLLFVRRGSLRIINQTMLPALMAKMKAVKAESRRDTITPSMLAAQQAKTMVTYAAKWRPELFTCHLDLLVQILEDSSYSEDVQEVALHALSSVAQLEPALVKNGLEKETHDSILSLVLQSRNWRIVKFGASYLAFIGQGKNDDECVGVVEAIATRFTDALSHPVESDEGRIQDDEELLCYVTVLTQFARFAMPAFEAQSETLVRYIVSRLLMLSGAESGVPEDQDWIDNASLLPFLRAKLMAIKCLRYRTLSFAHLPAEEAVKNASPLLKMLATLLDRNGTLQDISEDEEEDGGEDEKVMARMRLQAAVSLLHICTVEAYSNAFSPKFPRLALVAQDPNFEVRVTFLRKIIQPLLQRKLDPKYSIIPFLTVQDPEEDVKTMARSYVLGHIARLTPPQRVQNFELILIRLMHLLARHPDFTTEHADLQETSKYILHFLDLVATQDNVSLLYHLAGKGKTVRDISDEAEGGLSENFYVICEMTQELIKIRAHRQGWNINNFPGHLKLPSDILRPFPDNNATNKNLKEVYLPDETLEWLQAEIAKPVGGRGQKGVKRKAVGQASKGAGTKRKGKRRKSGDEDDDEAEERTTEGGAPSDVEMKEEDVVEERAPPPPAKRRGAAGASGKSVSKKPASSSKTHAAAPSRSNPKRKGRKSKEEEEDRDVDMDEEEEEEEEERVVKVGKKSSSPAKSTPKARPKPRPRGKKKKDDESDEG